MIEPYGLKHCAVQPAIHRRTRAAARGADRASSWLHPSRDLQRMRSEAAEALTCLGEKVLRHRDVNERRMDIAVPEGGREELQGFLWLDAGGIPFESAAQPEQVALDINAE